MFHSKYIVLLGEDYPQLLLLQHHIHNMGLAVRTAIADMEDVANLLQQQLPDLIILHLTDGPGYTAYVKCIRQIRLADEVPLIICRYPLDLSALTDILHIK